MLTENFPSPSLPDNEPSRIERIAQYQRTRRPEKCLPFSKNPILVTVFFDIIALFVFIVTAVNMKTRYEERLTSQAARD